MENNFHDAVNTKSNKELPPKPKARVGKEVLVDNSVVFIYDTGDTETYDNIKTLDDVISLQKAKPNVLIGIRPSLYSAFMDTSGNINPYVSVGDKVKFKDPKFADDKNNPILTIHKVYFKSLSNMSVIVVDFEEGGYSLANYLIKVNED